MDMLLLIGILLLNVFISVWNCYAVGTAWNEVSAKGGWFSKLILWSGAIQSGVGFSMPILIALAFTAAKVLTGGEESYLTPNEAKEMMQAIFNLWYVAVIFPILGTGLAITAHSLKVAYERRDFASVGTAAWNTFAQVHNTWGAVENLGGAFGNLGEFFGKALGGKGDGRAKVAILVVLLVVLALVGGFMIAFGLIRYFGRESVSYGSRYSRA